MVDVYEIRALLEPLALRRSLARATPDWMAAVTGAHRAMEDALVRPFQDMSATEYAAYERRHLDACQALDADAASAAMQAHMTRTQSAIAHTLPD